MAYQTQPMMTPYVAPPLTPLILQQVMPPWAVQTPEIWDRTPVHEGRFVQQEASVGESPKVISKELLRSVCEPFFDQMLLAVQQSLQATSKQGFHKQGLSQQQLAPSHMNDKGQGLVIEDASTFEGSDIVSECGAFSCIFAPLSNPVVPEKDLAKANEKSENVEALFSESTKVPCRKLPSQLHAQPMVCRHWRSKGWCRMEGTCKFLHPENKCGVSLMNSNPGCATSNANTSDTIAHTCISSDQSLAMTMDGKTKASNGKKRKNKGKPNVVQESQFPQIKLQDAQFAGDV